MNKLSLNREQWALVAGDTAALLVAVALGFASHENTAGFLSRFAYTFFPWTIAWFVAAPRFGLFELPPTGWRIMVWRVLAAMLLAAPLAGLLRALWLQSTVLPIFVLILGFSTALALIVWRLIFSNWLAKP